MLTRKSRLRKRFECYDSVGTYFVTICTYERLILFADPVDPSRFTPVGEIARETMLGLPVRFPMVTLDEWVVMPNHVHALINLGPLNPGLSEVVRAYKAVVSAAASKLSGIRGEKIWQRSFHESVVRDAEAGARITAYIRANPVNWAKDEMNAPGDLALS